MSTVTTPATGSTGASGSTGSSGEAPLLEVNNLSVRFPTYDGEVQAVTDLSYSVRRGQTLGIVGESGSGKSVSSMAVLGLHNPKQTRLEGSIRINGREVIGASESEMRKIRGREVAMIFQDPLTALHPFYTIGRQIIEAHRVHHKVSKSVARKRAVEVLDRVGIPQPQARVDDYPHQFSGGMRQRAMIAMALVNDPTLLIADEPTTALDVTVQAQILDLLQDLQREFNSAIVMITHDLGVIAEVADDVLVMYGGRAVETGSVQGDPGAPRDALHLGAALQHPRGHRAGGPPAGAHPGHPAQPAQPAGRLRVQPPVHLPRPGARRPVHDRAARAAPRRSRTGSREALPPARPRRGLRLPGQARHHRRGGPRWLKP